ncbi:replication restart DNA helicase PriA [Jatrophihabitans sp. GAS493]|nr:replication restart DNA helicase PriA [Jatrophihabitans sp. GAS493]
MRSVVAAESAAGSPGKQALQRGPAARSGRVPAPSLPIARLMVDVPLPHLDRAFDYVVPADLDEQVSAGSRVRVRFSGRLVDAYVLERLESSDHGGRLAFVERAVGSQPVLTPATSRLFRSVADRWAGNFVDVVRLGVPPRHARAEAAARLTPPGPLPAIPAVATGWSRYANAAGFFTSLAEGGAPRAIWSALPGESWPQRLAEAAHQSLSVGRGVLLVVPDARDLSRLDAALTAHLGPGHHVAISADLGPEQRYRRWLAVLRGDVRAVIGTRSAAFAPVQDLGLVVIWDDGDDLHSEPRAPYPHMRDVLVLRSGQSQAGLLVGGFARTSEAAYLVQSRWGQEITADRSVIRSSSPRISAAGDDFEVARDAAASSARVPSLAIRAARAALTAGRPVLVQVPRRGYVPALACARDRTPARCMTCAGPLAMGSGGGRPACRWCGRPATNWACPRCGSTRLRAVVTGSARTAEEFGRMFAGTVIRHSGGDSVLSDVQAQPEIIIATPGAEPVAAQGYGAALLLDAWSSLSRPELNAGEEALRRWANAVALVRADGEVVVVADSSLPVVQALIRWDPAGFVERELPDRHALRFPPYARLAKLTGPAHAVEDLLQQVQMPVNSEVIGTITVDEPPTAPSGSRALGAGAGAERAGVGGAGVEPVERAMVRSARMSGGELAAALKAAAAVRSARKAADVVKIELDPTELF